MTAQDDVRALAAVMTEADCASNEYPFSDESRARAVLESDWLRAREARLLAEARAQGWERAHERQFCRMAGLGQLCRCRNPYRPTEGDDR